MPGAGLLQILDRIGYDVPPDMGYEYCAEQTNNGFLKANFVILALLGKGGFGTVYAVGDVLELNGERPSELDLVPD